VVQVEGVLNSRPISYVSSEDLEEPLTPSHLLTGYRLLSIPDGAAVCASYENFLTSSDLNARAQNFAKALNQFWNRWRDEYLRKRYSNKENAKAHSTPVIGEVVLMHEEGWKRSQWRLGRIREVVNSSDGQIRGVVLKVKV